MKQYVRESLISYSTKVTSFVCNDKGSCGNTLRKKYEFEKKNIHFKVRWITDQINPVWKKNIKVSFKVHHSFLSWRHLTRFEKPFKKSKVKRLSSLFVKNTNIVIDQIMFCLINQFIFFIVIMLVYNHMKFKPFENMLYINPFNINHFRFWHGLVFCTK